MVNFDALTCCSLRLAYHNPIHSSLLHAFGELFGSPHLVDVFGGILDRTARLGFVPNEVAQTFYGRLARSELEVLSGSNRGALACGHALHDHVKALKAVSAKFPETRTS